MIRSELCNLRAVHKREEEVRVVVAAAQNTAASRRTLNRTPARLRHARSVPAAPSTTHTIALAGALGADVYLASAPPPLRMRRTTSSRRWPSCGAARTRTGPGWWRRALPSTRRSPSSPRCTLGSRKCRPDSPQCRWATPASYTHHGQLTQTRPLPITPVCALCALSRGSPACLAAPPCGPTLAIGRYGCTVLLRQSSARRGAAPADHPFRYVRPRTGPARRHARARQDARPPRRLSQERKLVRQSELAEKKEELSSRSRARGTT